LLPFFTNNGALWFCCLLAFNSAVVVFHGEDLATLKSIVGSLAEFG
jgi:hypothetical protein